MILGIFFLALSNANIFFAEQELTLRLYILAKALLIIKKVKVINKKKFIKGVLNENIETFIMYIVYLGTKISIYLA